MKKGWNIRGWVNWKEWKKKIKETATSFLWWWEEALVVLSKIYTNERKRKSIPTRAWKSLTSWALFFFRITSVKDQRASLSDDIMIDLRYKDSLFVIVLIRKCNWNRSEVKRGIQWEKHPAFQELDYSVNFLPSIMPRQNLQ